MISKIKNSKSYVDIDSFEKQNCERKLKESSMKIFLAEKKIRKII